MLGIGVNSILLDNNRKRRTAYLPKFSMRALLRNKKEALVFKDPDDGF